MGKNGKNGKKLEKWEKMGKILLKFERIYIIIYMHIYLLNNYSYLIWNKPIFIIDFNNQISFIIILLYFAKIILYIYNYFKIYNKIFDNLSNLVII